MTTWKKIAIRALFGGIGFAIAAAAITGAVVWYSNRPIPTAPWNTTALTATFNAIEYIVASSNTSNTYTVAFEYNVLNTTKMTYEVNTSALTPMAVLTQGKALSKTFGEYQSGDVTIDAPEFVPPSATGRITVRVPYLYPEDFTAADRNDFKKAVGPLNRRLKELSSIVLFDGLNHYQIDLPSGWTDSPGVEDGTTPDIDPSLLKKKTSATDLPPCPDNLPLSFVLDQPCLLSGVKVKGFRREMCLGTIQANGDCVEKVKPLKGFADRLTQLCPYGLPIGQDHKCPPWDNVDVEKARQKLLAYRRQ